MTVTIRKEARLGLAVAFVLAALTFSLSSCAKPGSEAPLATTTAAPAPTPVIEAAQPQGAPWYAARLEAMGFYVFPVPEPLPPMTVRELGGKEAGVQAMAGKVVLLNFWATWCPPCRAEMPSMQVLHDKTRDVAFDIMAVSVAEKRDTVTGFLKDNPRYKFPIFLDENGSASAPFVSRGIPTTFILDKQGRAIAGVVGAHMYDGPETVAFFRELAERL